MKYAKYIIFSMVSCLLAWNCAGCSSRLKENEVILAKVKDKSISLNEFLRRAEYTIRPSYCKNNTNIDKQIILNSLIAEKIFSLQSEKDTKYKITEDVETYLKGREEQAMRQLLYNEEVTKKIQVQNSSIEKYLKFANRTYDLSYISVTDPFIVEQLNEELNKSKLNFDTLITESYSLKEIPQKNVAFSNSENQILIDSLYTKDLKKNEVMGPVKITDSHYMFLKVNGWTDSPAITAQQIEEKLNKVKENLEIRQSHKIYSSFVQEVMTNKRIEFNRDIFFEFTDLVAPIYLKTNKEKENLFVAGVWDNELDKEKYKEASAKLDALGEELIFEVGNEKWTVGKLMAELKRHPLVFRKYNIPNKEFGFQLQMAIIDMISDKYLTKIAYERGYDKDPIVVRNKMMWEDNLKAVAYKYNYLQKNNLDSLFHKDYVNVMDKYLNQFVDSLQQEYSDSIFINTDVLKEIKLARIDMVANYSNAPFKTVVPNFPIITTNSRLKYGQKFSKEEKD